MTDSLTEIPSYSFISLYTETSTGKKSTCAFNWTGTNTVVYSYSPRNSVLNLFV